MKRVWLPVALLLSLGVNLGLLAAVAAGRWSPREEPAAAVEEPAAPLATGAAIEIPGAGGEEVELPVPERPIRGAAGSGDAGPQARGEPGVHGEPGAHGEAGAHGAGAGVLVERFADHLGLQGERRERFVALQRELVANHRQALRERRRLRGELHRELVAAAPDRQRLEAITAEMGRFHTDNERRSAGLILDSRALLEPDQQRVYLGFLERLHGGPHRGGAGAGRHFQHHRPRR